MRIGSVEYEMLKRFRDALDPEIREEATLPVPVTDDELWELTRQITGLEIPRTAVCAGHSSPFEAFADAYFARYPLCIWLASRGLAGKSVTLASLAMVEAATLGASVSLLGGSGEQSKRVHDYMTGEDTNLPNMFWKNPTAPRHLVRSSSGSITRLTNNGRIKVLMASSTSVRGPHPQRLRIDEGDEVNMEIMEAALGQPMSARGIASQVVVSSTHQYPNGTMTEMLRRVSTHGYKLHKWCYRETINGWLTPADVEVKKSLVTKQTWDTEYDLQEPSIGDRAIDTLAVTHAFSLTDEIQLSPGDYYEYEAPQFHTEIRNNKEVVVWDGRYVTSADWAKKQDWTAILTIRVDVRPVRLVAFEYTGRLPWPQMVNRFEYQVKRYNSEAIHDGTGLGTVVDDLLYVSAYAMTMQGRMRRDIFSNWIGAIESGDFRSPNIVYMRDEHRYCRVGDLYTESGHPPDTFIAGALAWFLFDSGWSRPAA